MGSVSVVTTVKWFWFFVGVTRTAHHNLLFLSCLVSLETKSLSFSASLSSLSALVFVFS